MQSKNGPKFLMFNVHSSITLWELYDHTARIFEKSPLKIVLKRVTLGKPELKDTDFSRSLTDLRFEDNEELMLKVLNVSNKKMPLFSHVTQDLTQQAKAIFSSWFNIYSEEDPDEAQNRKVMTPESCCTFFQACGAGAGIKNAG
jgi:hypothetical protein